MNFRLIQQALVALEMYREYTPEGNGIAERAIVAIKQFKKEWEETEVPYVVVECSCSGKTTLLSPPQSEKPEQDEVDIRSRLYQRIHELETQLAQPEDKKCENCGEFGECCQDAQPEQEPVAWYDKDGVITANPIEFSQPLYTTSPQPEKLDQDEVDIRSRLYQRIHELETQLAQPEDKKCENCGEFGECCQDAQPEQEPVAIEYWLQDTMESGRWVKSEKMARATAERMLSGEFGAVFSQGRIVEPTLPPQRKEPEQAPVAYINIEERKLEWAYKYMSWDTPTVINLPKIPLYTTPPQRKPLNDEMRKQMKESCDSDNMEMRGAFIDGWTSAEAAHGIKE